MRIKFLVTAIVLLGVSLSVGCSNTEEARQEMTRTVLEADPAFNTVLEEYQRITNQMQAFERQWELKERLVAEKVDDLKQQLEQDRETVRERQNELTKEIEPERQALRELHARTSEELRQSQLQRSTLGRSIAKLRKAVKLAGEAWPVAERERQDEQLAQMLRDANRIDQEIELYKQAITLLEAKLHLIDA